MAKKTIRYGEQYQMSLPIPIDERETLNDARSLADILLNRLHNLREKFKTAQAKFKVEEKELLDRAQVLARNVSFAERQAEVTVEKRVDLDSAVFKVYRTDKRGEAGFVSEIPMTLEDIESDELAAVRGELEHALSEREAAAKRKKGGAGKAKTQKASGGPANAKKAAKTKAAKPSAKPKTAPKGNGKANGNGKAHHNKDDFDDMPPIYSETPTAAELASL